jgi:hypothetical protein
MNKEGVTGLVASKGVPIEKTGVFEDFDNNYVKRPMKTNEFGLQGKISPYPTTIETTSYPFQTGNTLPSPSSNIYNAVSKRIQKPPAADPNNPYLVSNPYPMMDHQDSLTSLKNALKMRDEQQFGHHNNNNNIENKPPRMMKGSTNNGGMYPGSSPMEPPKLRTAPPKTNVANGKPPKGRFDDMNFTHNNYDQFGMDASPISQVKEKVAHLYQEKNGGVGGYSSLSPQKNMRYDQQGDFGNLFPDRQPQNGYGKGHHSMEKTDFAQMNARSIASVPERNKRVNGNSNEPIRNHDDHDTRVYSANNAFFSKPSQASQNQDYDNYGMPETGYATGGIRKSAYRPYTLKEYKESKDVQGKALTQLGGLGPNLGGEEWQKKREKIEKMNNFALGVKIVNAQKLPPASMRKPKMEEIPGKSKRDAMIEFAKNVPKPRARKSEADNDIIIEEESTSKENDLEKFQRQHLHYLNQVEKIKIG